MHKGIWPLLGVYFFMPFVLAAQEEVKLAKVPVVLEAQGETLIKNKDGEKRQLKKGEILRETAWLITGEKSQLSLEMSDGSILFLMPGTEINFPVITWDQGEVKFVELKHGKLRALQKGGVERQYSTPLSLDQYPSSDFVLDYSPTAGKVTLTLLRGEVYFRGLSNEEGVHIKRGERATFQGAFENGELTYDVLLKGRRVARGTLLPIETLPEAEISALTDKLKVEKPKPKPPPPKPPRKKDQICDEPYGRLNECAWVCKGIGKKAKKCDLALKGVKCLRTRCDANGKWSDAFEVPDSKSPCGPSPVVGPCDY